MELAIISKLICLDNKYKNSLAFNRLFACRLFEFAIFMSKNSNKRWLSDNPQLIVNIFFFEKICKI